MLFARLFFCRAREELIDGVARVAYNFKSRHILGLIIGVVLLFSPMLSAITMVGLISFYLIVIGIVKIIQAF